jgi:hypothetical protein
VNTLLESRDVWIENDFIPNSHQVFSQLVDTIPWDESIRARKVASFGVPYNYSGIIWPEAPFPTEIMEILNRVEDRLAHRPNNCLANYYPTGDSSMGFHFDSTENLVEGSGIVVISLGAERTITFRHFDDRTRQEHYLLKSGSILYMSAQMQLTWRHAILADKDLTDGRISLTFRAMKPLWK